MIRPGDVRNVFCPRMAHVTADAVWVFRMMRCRELRLAMAGKAPGPEKCSALCRRRREVGIVTARAGHLIPTHTFACALSELFNFAYSAGSQAVSGVDIEGEIVGDRIAGTIIKRGTPRPFH